MTRRAVWALALGALAACDDFDGALERCWRSGRCLDAGAAGGGAFAGGSGGGGGMGGGVDAGRAGGGAPPCAITVTAFTHHLVDGPEVVRVPHGGPVSVLVPEGSGYAELSASTDGGGSFCVAQAPDAGPLLVRLGADVYVQTPLRAVDLSRWVRGRPDLARRQLSIGLELPALGTYEPPWSADDGGAPEHFVLSSDGAALSARVVLPLRDGETDAGHRVFAVSTDAPIQSSRGDVVQLLRCSRTDARTCVTRQQTRGVVETGDAGTFTVDAGALTPVALDRTVALRWEPPTATQRYELNAYDAGYATSAGVLGFLGPFRYRLELWADPHDAGWVDPTGLLASVAVDGNPLAVSFNYGSPRPGPVSISASATAATPFLAGSATMTVPVETSVRRVMAHRSADAGAFVLPDPPRALTLNGTPIEQLPYLSDLSQPVAVAWSAPAAAPTQFSLELWRVSADGSATTVVTSAATFWLPSSSTSLTLPTLPAGEYALRLSAVTSEPFDAAEPLRPAPNFAVAQTLVRPFVVR